MGEQRRRRLGWVWPPLAAPRVVEYTDAMILKLTEELRLALRANPDKPLRVEDEQTNRVYLVLSEEALPSFWADYIRREVAKGLDAIDRGEVEDWDVQSIKAEGRRIFEQGPSPAS